MRGLACSAHTEVSDIAGGRRRGGGAVGRARWVGGVGPRAERECDVPPRLEVRRGARQMPHHSADRVDHVDPQRQEPVAQTGHLWVRAHLVCAARSRSCCIST